MTFGLSIWGGRELPRRRDILVVSCSSSHGGSANRFRCFLNGVYMGSITGLMLGHANRSCKPIGLEFLLYVGYGFETGIGADLIVSK